MRKTFATELLKYAKQDKDIVLITCDLGFGMWDEFQETLPDQFYNVGASEMAGTGIAVGMSYEGKKVFLYSITPFLLWRPAEVIRNYINHEKAPIRLVASGRDKDYAHDGFSHDATDDKDILKAFRNITTMYPQNTDQVKECVAFMVNNNIPAYCNLKR